MEEISYNYIVKDISKYFDVTKKLKERKLLLGQKRWF